MLTGKRFKILRPTVALESERYWVQIPPGAIVEVTAGPNGSGNRLAEALWEGRKVSMFATDLKASLEMENWSVGRGTTPGTSGAA